MGGRDHSGRAGPPDGGGPHRGVLRVGAVLDERDFRRWQSTALSELMRSGACELTVFTDGSAGDAPVGGVVRRLRKAGRHWVFRAYERADRQLFGHDDDALAPDAVDRDVGGVTRRLHLRGDRSSRFQAIAAEELDVVLCLAPELSADDLAGCARLGAWSMHVGGLAGRRDEAQLFWEMHDGDHLAAVALQAHTSDEGARTIYRSVVKSDPASLHRGRCVAFQRAAQLPARRIRDLHQRGWPAIASLPVSDERRPTAEPRSSMPTNATMLRFIWRVVRGSDPSPGRTVTVLLSA
jgi:hypothetical protein